MDHASEELDAFRARVYLRGRGLYRDLPWRRTRDAYAIWVSEAMLQQTQVSRVDGRWQRWLERFPSVAALARRELGGRARPSGRGSGTTAGRSRCGEPPAKSSPSTADGCPPRSAT